jgi:hypothetical protein
MPNYLEKPEDYHASIVEWMMEQQSPPIPISLGMAKVEDLKPMIIGLRPCALSATRNWIKARYGQKPKGYRSLRMHTEKPLVNFLKEE